MENTAIWISSYLRTKDQNKLKWQLSRGILWGKFSEKLKNISEVFPENFWTFPERFFSLWEAAPVFSLYFCSLLYSIESLKSFILLFSDLKLVAFLATRLVCVNIEIFTQTVMKTQKENLILSSNLIFKRRVYFFSYLISFMSWDN